MTDALVKQSLVCPVTLFKPMGKKRLERGREVKKYREVVVTSCLLELKVRHGFWC